MNKNEEIQFFETQEKQPCKKKTVLLQGRFSSKPKYEIFKLYAVIQKIGLFGNSVNRGLPVSMKEKS